MHCFRQFARLVMGAMLAVSAEGALAADQTLPSVQDFFRPPKLSHAKLSPDGMHVGALLTDDQQQTCLIVIGLAKPVQSKAIACYKQNQIDDFDWVSDKRLYYTALDSDFEAQSDGSGGIYAVDFDGGNGRRLTTTQRNYNQQSTGSNIASKLLAGKYWIHSVPHDGTDDIIVYKDEYNEVRHRLYQSMLYRLNTRNQKLTQIVDRTPGDVTGWVLDIHGQPKVLISSVNGINTIYYLPSRDGKWESVASFKGLSEEAFEPEFIDANDQLYVKALHGQDTAGLYRFDLKKHAIVGERVLNIDGFDYKGDDYGNDDVHDVETAKLLGIRYQNDAWATYWLDADMAAVQKKIDEQLPETINTISCLKCEHSPYLLVNTASDREPDSTLVYERASGNLTRLGFERPWIKPEQMGTRDFVHYKARDGLSIPAYVTTPPGPKQPRPTVVLVHGGPWVRGASWRWNPEVQFLASRGYVVIEPEFRGSEGYGSRLFEAGWKQWGLKMQDDVADAAQWAIASGLSDPKRIAIAGASYGGYATLMGLIKNPELFSAGFEWVGVTDINLMFSVHWSDISYDSVEYGYPTLIGDPKEYAKQFDETSPIKQAARLKQPLLMAYGLEDYRVPLIHGEQFRDAVQKQNHDVEWVTYPNEGHGWHMLETNVDFWSRVERFLAKNLAGDKVAADSAKDTTVAKQ